jgi:hypothetical protein
MPQIGSAAATEDVQMRQPLNQICLIIFIKKQSLKPVA